MYCEDQVKPRMIHGVHFMCVQCLKKYSEYLRQKRMDTEYVKCPARGCVFYFFIDDL